MYLRLMSKYCRRCGVEIWAYCLMPNHIHLIAVPECCESLGQAVGRTHWKYTQIVNEREDWTGHLFQARFSSYPMDEKHLLTAARYIELNPVMAGLVKKPVDWQWSSAKCHLSLERDALVDPRPLLDRVSNWACFLEERIPSAQAIRRHLATGRPLGDEAFVKRCEQALDRVLSRQKPGPKPRRNKRR